MLGLSRRTQADEPFVEIERAATISMRELAIASIAPNASLTASKKEALAHSAVIACLDILCGAHSQTPIDVVRTQRDKRTPVEPQPEVIASPSAMVTQDVWHSQVAFSLHTDGNAFAMVAGTDRLGFPTQLETIDPSVVEDRRVEDGIPTVKIGTDVHKLWPHGDIWHVPGRLVPAGQPWGLSPLQAASESIGIGLAASRFSGRFLRDGGMPPIMLSVTSATTQDTITKTKAQWRNLLLGNREPVVMSGDIKAEKLAFSPEEMEFDETAQFIVQEICRFLFVPPPMVFAAMSGQSVTYANLSQSDSAFLKYSLAVPMGRVERALSAILPDGQNVKWNFAAFLRADTVTRYGSYDVALRNGWLNVNEVRALEDLPPIPGGDVYQTSGGQS